MLEELKLLKSIGEVFTSISTGTLSKIVEMLSTQEMDARSLAASLNVTDSYVYKLLGRLEKYGFIDYRFKDGRKVFHLNDKWRNFIDKTMEYFSEVMGESVKLKHLSVGEDELSELIEGYGCYLKLAYLHGLITSKELVEKKKFLKKLGERFKAHGLRVKFI